MPFKKTKHCLQINPVVLFVCIALLAGGCTTVEKEIAPVDKTAEESVTAPPAAVQEKDPAELEMKRNLSRGYEAFKQKNFSEAEKRFNTVVEIEPDNIKAAFYLAEIYFQTERLEESLNKFQYVIDNEKDPKKYYDRALNRQAAIISQSREDIDKLLTVYLEIINNNPEDVDTRLRVAAMYEMQGNTAKAIEYYKEIHSIAPDDATSAFRLGKLLYQERDYKGAVEVFQSIVDGNAQDEEALYFLAICNKKLGKLSTAEKLLLVLLDLRPDYPNAAMHLGDIYKKQKQYTRMINTYERLLIREPNSVKFLNQISIGCIESGQLDRAEVYINKALRINPLDGETLVRQGELFEAHGDKSKKAFEKQKCKRFGKQANKYYNQAKQSYSGAVNDPQMSSFASSKLEIVEQKRIPDEELFFAKDC